MLPIRPPLASVLALLALLTGCAAEGLRQGVRDYENARYPEALADLQRVMADSPCLSKSDWTRYALYRGLTELALGNAETAHAWLLGVQRSLDRQPMLLDATDRARLSVAWRSLGLLPAQR